MKAKLDENLGTRGARLLAVAGWDVSTVVAQSLCSVADATLAEVCRVEQRVLITLDTDFANTLRFRPSRYAGLIVLRLPEPLNPDTLFAALERVVALSRTLDPVGKLWIVDGNRIREFVED